MPYADKGRQRKAQLEHLRRKKASNPQWYSGIKKQRRLKRDNIHDIINHIKSTMGCLLCDEKDYNKLQFHHVIPGFKVACVSHLIGDRARLITVLKEIDKCICVCTACHKHMDRSLLFVSSAIRNEKWSKDWTLKESLEWAHLHPQIRNKKSDFIEVIKAVARNCQMQDPLKFRKAFDN